MTQSDPQTVPPNILQLPAEQLVSTPSFREFAYNNALSTSISTFPFFSNKGYRLNIIIHPECELASQCACEFVIDLDELHIKLCSQLFAAQKYYQGPVDHQWTPAPNFKVGEQAFIKAKNIHTTCLSKKLSEKSLGPFNIITPNLVHIQSPCGFQTISVPFIQPSTSLSWNAQLQTPFQIVPNLHHL
jgi:hypothetical protein